jgi:hypothetical protein
METLTCPVCRNDGATIEAVRNPDAASRRYCSRYQCPTCGPFLGHEDLGTKLGALTNEQRPEVSRGIRARHDRGVVVDFLRPGAYWTALGLREPAR